MFVHLHVRSCYSFLEASAQPVELAQFAAQAGQPAIALTDHSGMSGAVEFTEGCQAAGVQPILGLEVDLAQTGQPAALASAVSGRHPLVLLAMNAAGWTSLCRLSSYLRSSGTAGAEPALELTLEGLADFSAGLICLTGGQRAYLDSCLRAGAAPAAQHWLHKLAEVFPDRLYVELDACAPSPGRAAAARLAQRTGLPVVAAAPVYYLLPEEAPVQRLLSAIRMNRPLQGLPAGVCAPPEAHFLGTEELERRFQDLPQAMAATLEIAARCQFSLPLHKPLFPHLAVPAGQTPGSLLRQRAEAGAVRLYGEVSPGLRQRLDHELEVIEGRGYAVLFLIVEEILGYARQRGVPLSSRGSAASSLVAHCLGLTSPDPLRLNLYFERFLNPARKTPPDIDTDLCSRRRDDVIRFVYHRFGADRVAMVSTVNRFRRRSALRETAKAYGLSPRQVSALVDELPRWDWGPPHAEEDPGSPYADLEARYPAPLYQAIFKAAAALRGLPRHLSIHPGGIVISPQQMTEIAPTQLASKGVVISQFDLESIESLGLVKIDLLGIRGLSVLGDVAQWLSQSEGITARDGLRPRLAAGMRKRQEAELSPVDWLDAIPEDDREVAEVVRSGRTIGCFQIESPGMRATLREIQANSVDDIMAALALYRPGPLLGGLKDAFVRRHRGTERIAHLHPALEPLLADTYGVILYQEQVLRIAHELAGLTLADADLLRRAMSHFDPGKEMQTLKEKFVAGAAHHHHLPAPLAERVWEMMAAFAGYGFPKAHAASYAQVAWRSAWCKTHLPGVFMAAVLANWGGYYGQRVYLNEARRLGLAVHPPHVNHSEREFCLHIRDGQTALYMGLDQVRDLTRKTQERILRNRPYRSLGDFLVRADPRPVEAENLVTAGAFAGLGAIPALLRQVKAGQWLGGQLPLFSFTGEGGAPETEADWSPVQKMAGEAAVLGLGVSVHPLDLAAAQLEAAGARTTVEAVSLVGQEVRLVGMRQTWRRSRSAQGEPVYFMALEDLEGMLDILIPSAIYQRDRQELAGGGPFIVEGLVVRDTLSGEPLLRASRITHIEL